MKEFSVSASIGAFPTALELRVCGGLVSVWQTLSGLSRQHKFECTPAEALGIAEIIRTAVLAEKAREPRHIAIKVGDRFMVFWHLGAQLHVSPKGGGARPLRFELCKDGVWEGENVAEAFYEASRATGE